MASKSNPALEQIQALRVPFPEEALSADMSRGFMLTSIRAAYVIERLKEVFGLCGTGWCYVHNDFEFVESREEVITEVALQYRVEEGGCPPIQWSKDVGWTYRENGSSTWSEPIFACGGKKVGKGSVAYTDARKSAVTDSLTKASSLLGIGHSVFKGLRRADRQNTSKNGSGNGKHHSTNDEANATILWSLFNSQAKPAGVSRNDAAQLIDYDNWNKSCVDLRVLINKTQAVAVR